MEGGSRWAAKVMDITTGIVVLVALGVACWAFYKAGRESMEAEHARDTAEVLQRLAKIDAALAEEAAKKVAAIEAKPLPEHTEEAVQDFLRDTEGKF